MDALRAYHPSYTNDRMAYTVRLCVVIAGLCLLHCGLRDRATELREFLYTDTQCGDVMGINERDVSIRKYPDMGIVENECGVELGIGFGCLLFEFRNLEFPTFSVWHFEF